MGTPPVLALVVDEADVVAEVVEALDVVAEVVEALELVALVELAEVVELAEFVELAEVAPPPPAPPAPPAPSSVAASPQPISTVACKATTARPNDHFDLPSTPRSKTLFIMSSKRSIRMARH
ncbi:hypothetical protein WME79_08080 [Sorangium sp. So ce726]|uniref:hypothetical protein n=1 Tax=Sorangium sp. So ce726 TaxID=3133319 RepID=UPI003F5E53DD